MMGPSIILDFSENITIIGAGLFIVGLSTAPPFCVSLPEAMEVIQQEYMIVEDQNPQLD